MNLISKVCTFRNIQYIFLLLCIQIFAVIINYNNLFDYERCTEILTRNINLFSFSFDLIYPKMCDEPFYFHGFQWFQSIYEYGYVYQDRQLYLLIGFLFYRCFYLLSYVSGFFIEPVSLLLFSTFIMQLIIVNTSSFLVSLVINKRFDRLYFILYFLIIFFSFEQRRYFFLPSSSTIYFLIFVFSIYSIQKGKINGLIFGLFFTISGYGVVGFLYQLINKSINLKTNIVEIFKNLVLFILPSLFFEGFRIIIGFIKGPEYGVKYVYSAEEYQQFIWVFRLIFDKTFVPSNKCQSFYNFYNCYFEQTISFFTVMKFYFLIFFVVLFFLTLSKKNKKVDLQIIALKFTIFSYLFILFQGYYGFRIIYYSLGFGLLLLVCVSLYNFNNFYISGLITTLFSYYTISRDSYSEYINLKSWHTFEILILIILTLFISIKLFRKKVNNSSIKSS